MRCEVDVYRIQDGVGLSVTNIGKRGYELCSEREVARDIALEISGSCGTDGVYVVSVRGEGPGGIRENLLMRKGLLGDLMHRTTGEEGLSRLIEEARELVERPLGGQGVRSWTGRTW